MFQKSKISAAMLLAFNAAFISAASAQDLSDVQRVEVTGSAIKRIASEGALPIQTITEADIKKSGFTTTTELVQNLSAMQGFTTASQSINGGGGGVTTASLHGLGSQYTLVLLNGRRLAPYNTGSEVNLNSIPLGAIERVEVLTDGASALYGADAIAGVVNFITRKDSTGGDISLSAYVPQKTGGRSATASITKGFGDLSKDHYNVLLTATFDEQQALWARQRSFSKSGVLTFKDAYGDQEVDLVSSNNVPANARVVLDDGTKLAFNPDKVKNGSCIPGDITAGDFCYYDYSATVQDIPKEKRVTLFGSGRYDISDKVSVYTEIAASNFHTDATYAAVAQPFSISSALLAKDIDPLLAQLGFAGHTAASGTMNVRLLDTGGRTDRYETDALHAVLGTDFTIGNFDSSLTYTHSQARALDKAAGGYASTNALDALLDSGAFDPLTSKPGAATALLAPTVLHQTLDEQRSSIDVLNARTSTTIAKLPGGDLGFAAGVDIQHQKFSDSPAAISQGANSLQPTYTDSVFGGASGLLPFDSSRNSYGAFGELSAPITKALTVDGTLRYDAYDKVKNKDGFDSAGKFIGEESQGKSSSATTVKLSTSFRPTKELLLRGSIGTGFKVPTIADISNPQEANGNTGMHSCPTGLDAAKAAFCQTGQYEYNIAKVGNPATDSLALKPERSTQWTIGGRFEPSPAFSLGLDLWSVQIRNQINDITEDTAFNNGAQYGYLFDIIKDPINGQPTLTFLQTPVNTGKAQYQGIDFDGESHVSTPIGKLTTRADVTWMLKANYQTPGTPGYINSLNKIGIDGQVMFRWQAAVSFSLETGSFTNTLTVRAKPGYKDDYTDYCYNSATGYDGDLGCSPDDGNRRVSAYTTFDWQTKYDVNKVFAVTAGIRNLFDRNPPFTINDQAGTSNARGYDGRYADPLGRTFYASASYKF